VEYASHTLERMVEVFSRLPGIGPKSAQRIALYLLKEGRAECEELAKVVSDLAFKVKPCSVCFNLNRSRPLRVLHRSRPRPGVDLRGGGAEGFARH